MRNSIFLIFLFSCMLSREDQMKSECKNQRERTYQYMIPLLDRHSVSTDRALAESTYALVAEYTDIRCNAKAGKNKYNLRSN